MHHLVIPHRNRLDCLISQAHFINEFINKNELKDNITVNYVEQQNEIFNLGYNINAGFKILEKNYKIKPEDNFWFFPVDVLPKTYLLSEDKIFLGVPKIEENKTFSIALGKSWGTKVKDFKKANGFSIKGYGHAHEDHEWWHRALFYKMERVHISNESSFEHFDYLNSNQPDGLKDDSNVEKNRNLFHISQNRADIYEQDGLSSTEIEVVSRFPLFFNTDAIFYNKFKILNILT